MRRAEAVKALVILGLVSFASSFAITRYHNFSGNADRSRDECRAAAAAVVESPKYLHAVGSKGGRDKKFSWELRVRRVGPHDVYILVESISPPLINGRNSFFIRTSENEKAFRTQAGDTNELTFKHSIAFGGATTRKGRLPFIYPVKGESEITQADGHHSILERNTHPKGMKHAVDISAAIGARVVAGMGGRVVHVVDDFPDIGCYLPELEGRSNLVVIVHDDGSEALYGHLMRDSVVVDVGDRVNAGDLLAMVGNSGMSSRPHLHLQVGGMTSAGYKTTPLLFQGCSAESFMPALRPVHCA